MIDASHVERFRRLFRGLDTAFGTGDKPGRWIKRPPRTMDFIDHLTGRPTGIGIAPLMPDNKVWFAAIDLDEPDFETALKMQKYIPGESWIERTRSGNVHVWVFFAEPIEAWLPMGVLKEVCNAVEKPSTEVFPKNFDFQRVRLGNYINLPYHGTQRPILWDPLDPQAAFDLVTFLDRAEAALNNPRHWEQRASMYLLQNPADRKPSATAFGEQDNLHMCAEYIIERAIENPICQGHQANTFFLLAKQLSNWRLCDHDEALAYMREVNNHAIPGVPDAELRRILRNAEEKRYTSTGCDDPIVAPYIHPDCPIAHPRRP